MELSSWICSGAFMRAAGYTRADMRATLHGSSWWIWGGGFLHQSSSPWEAAAITTCTYYQSIIQLLPICTSLTLTCCCGDIEILFDNAAPTGPLLQTGLLRVMNTQSIEAAAYWRLLCRTLHGQGGVGGQYNIVGGSPRPGTLLLLGAARVRWG